MYADVGTYAYGTVLAGASSSAEQSRQSLTVRCLGARLYEREMAIQVKDIEVGAGAGEAVPAGVRKPAAARQDA
jgi:hypothetical protein